jgi:putative ABC transport system substrate-binding protein
MEQPIFVNRAGSVAWPCPGRAAAGAVLIVLLFSADRSFGQSQNLSHLLGFISSASRESTANRINMFEKRLRDLGHKEGQVVIDYRWTNGRDELLSVYANEFAQRPVKVIVTHGNVATEVAASTKLPVVCFTCGDLRLVKGVASLARPGGNITGVSAVHPDTAAKRLQLLRELVPDITRADLLYKLGNPVSEPEVRASQEAAKVLNIKLHLLGVNNPAELRTVLSSRTRQDADALLVISDAMIHGRISDIVALTAAGRMPVITPWGSEFVKAGGLIGYGPDTLSLVPQAASQVDRILRGANPGDIPIEQPTRFELYVNLKTAKALALEVPLTVLYRANEVVE